VWSTLDRETGFTGLAAGAALSAAPDRREYQFADFISCAFDPIINAAGIITHWYHAVTMGAVQAPTREIPHTSER
jgi:pyruvate/2-oxoglutarate/acetoin dehydrogenase E1 component